MSHIEFMLATAVAEFSETSIAKRVITIGTRIENFLVSYIKDEIA